MSKPVTIGTVIIAAVAVMGSLLMWRSMADTRIQLQQTQEENRVLQTQLADAAVIEAAAVPDGPATTNADWCDVRLHFVTQTADGSEQPLETPVIGLRKLHETRTETETQYSLLTLAADDDGLVEFGPLRCGSYCLTINERDRYGLVKEITLQPGEPYEETIVCPDELPEHPVELTFELGEISVPDELRDRVWLLVQIQQPAFFLIGTLAGSAVETRPGGTEVGGNRWWIDVSRSGLLHADGRFIPVDWPIVIPKPPTGPDAAFASIPPPHLAPSITLDNPAALQTELSLPEGEYVCAGELVIADEDLTTFQLALHLDQPPTGGRLTVEGPDRRYPVRSDETNQWVVLPDPSELTEGDWMDEQLWPDIGIDRVLITDPFGALRKWKRPF